MAIKRSHNSTPAAEENLLTPNPTIEETEKAEAQIRPQSLEDYIGQQDLKANLKVTIAAAKARQEAIDHLLFYGPPGLGKTTMALILAAEMGVNCRITAAPALERPRDITGILINLQPRDILFIDEIHRLNRVTEELLYPAMEDYRLDVTIGKGQAAKIRSISLPPFTLIGATTKVGSLTSPLRDRFGMIQRLRFYTVEELTTIILRSATIFNIPMTEAGAIEIARRGRGTPRIANRLLKRVRDYVQVKGETMITPQLAAEGLNQLNVDSMGLDWTDRLVLKTMIEQFQGRPVGLEAVAAATGEDAKTIEEVYEPYLLQIGYLNRTARGRVVTAAAYEHLGLLAKLPKKNDRSLPLFEL
ncbi:MAG: Holliday junction branch migration DNA helicase RuvB [Microcystis sp.]|jgi:Holliday junction DNA helicase RuvB|uniref:Holliday junction branch migration complex subunit RuvB n=4 Tax=Microcystis TaxID=1125 RepID=A0A552KFE7_9CHRO|nr:MULTISPECIES: Holliday junction branch migration DNA helicase RuvB [unclassified Microcystis]MCA2818113.1 Holliday junction branch migration DNA helicase RuvB [Microcystis sp. M085S1]MCA2854356.1 Holliday junction branch migration DNA helicase RuvB [Microcystis sp. M065S1]MDJ0548404.1 Holliday junction branch migration DNA helicase RuvB [Microcystis sp. M49637_WE12]TRT78197.1 MAG: Holliday junction branch migration DNA helicase RuvB [Microcystis flos-aquae Ma_QC_C_20070823_S18]TRU01754.1 MA